MRTEHQKEISRKTTAYYEQLKRDAGLRKTTLWIPDNDDELQRIKKYIAKRCKAHGIDY